MYYLLALAFTFVIGFSFGWQRSKKKMMKKLAADWKKTQEIAIEKVGEIGEDKSLI